MKILADENIPLVDKFFSGLGEITTAPGRQISSAQLNDIDVLLVRSVTRVDEALLKDSKVRFVASATIGTDHIDLDYLQQQDIKFVNAPGCNAPSVVDYVCSVLSILSERNQFDIRKISVGVVGAGNVGSRLVARMKALGLEVKVYDPLLENQEGLNTLDDVLTCDVVSLHTPLTTTAQSEFPTRHLMGEVELNKMPKNGILINSARGPVVDNKALYNHLTRETAFTAVLDVWEFEPQINLELMKLCAITTPHIAGYSLDGKLMGTSMAYQALCDFLDVPAAIKLPQLLPQSALKNMSFSTESDDIWALNVAIRACYDVRGDDARFRHAMLAASSEQDMELRFDELRKKYPVRREFSSVKVRCDNRQHTLEGGLKALGFSLKS
jgi:erythronate-4-phosphate dehydrogenase